MSVTKEAIEAAAIAMHELDGDHKWADASDSARESARRYALAALSTLPIAGEGKVKALEWTGEEGGPGHDVYAKPSGYHHYTVRHLSEAKFDVILHTDTGSIWFAQEKRGNYHGTYAEAKAAAQADYDLRGAEFSSPGKEGRQEVEAVAAPEDVVDAFKAIIQTVNDKSLDLKSVRIRVWGFARNALKQLEGSNND